MKTFSIVYLAVLVAAVAGSPHPHPDAAAVAEPVSAPDADILDAGLTKRRRECHHRSECGRYDWSWCSSYCSRWSSDMSYMDDCGRGYYRCCCSRS